MFDITTIWHSVVILLFVVSNQLIEENCRLIQHSTMKTSTEVNDERVRFVNSVTPQSSPYLTKKPSETKEDIELGSVFEHHEPSTFLRRLVIEGHVEKLREYCAIESELEFLDDNGMAVIHYAAKLNRAEIVMLLLDFGANIDARSTDNMTPLHIACK